MTKTLLFDLEGNGLLPDLSTIHCLVIKDPEAEEYMTFHDDVIDLVPDGSVKDGIEVLEAADQIVAHNIIGYDADAIKKIYPKTKLPTVLDTLILTQMFWPNEMKDPSIESWGRKLKYPKVKHEDWSTFSRDMLHRCVVDVKILNEVWKRCVQQMEEHDWSKAVEFEHEVYRTFVDSGQYWHFDYDLCSELHKKAEIEVEESRNKLKELHGGYYTGDPGGSMFDQDHPVRSKKKNGELTSRALKWCEEVGLNPEYVSGDFNRLFYHDYNPGSTQQTTEWLLNLGWQPANWTYHEDHKGRPLRDSKGNKKKKNPSTKGKFFPGVPKNVAEAYYQFKSVAKVFSTYLSNWRDNSIKDEDDLYRLYMHALTTGTVTARWRHKFIANIPSESAPYGKEVRKCFVAPPGYVLIGCDASQIELMIDAHFVSFFDNGARLEAIQTKDVHQELADVLGIKRQEAKAFNYAISYGGGAQMLAEMLDVSPEKASELYSKYREVRWELNELIDHLHNALIHRGYAKRSRSGYVSIHDSRAWIKGIDGRKLFIREPHMINNTLIQSTGAIVMKKAYVDLANIIKEKKLDARIAMLIHDEYQIVCKDDEATIAEVTRLAVDCIEQAAKYYKLKCPLTGEAKVGKNWQETH